MFKGLGNIASMMRQAGQIGGKMKEITEKLQNERATGQAGGGMVECEVNGLGQVLSIKIEPSLVENNELEMIQDLLPAAINQAIGKSKQMHMEAMKEATGGLELPGLDQALNDIAGNSSGEDQT